jgi:hypothetical protein
MRAWPRSVPGLRQHEVSQAELAPSSTCPTRRTRMASAAWAGRASPARSAWPARTAELVRIRAGDLLGVRSMHAASVTVAEAAAKAGSPCWIRQSGYSRALRLPVKVS